MASQRRIPIATYRLQFNSQFTLGDAVAVADYLRELGVSDLYASPLFKASPSSTHGYDVCAFDKLNPTLGTEQDFDTLTGKLRQSGMGLLLDMVPNHMGSDCSNSWLADVLARGRDSPYADWFDINWDSAVPGLQGKVLLPILEDHYAKVLGSGKLRLAHNQGKFDLRYHDRNLPLSASTEQQLRAEAARDSVERVLQRYNGREGDPASFDTLHQVIEQQHYRLAYWRLAGKIINYRRFFDVTELFAIRVESPDVFSAVHALVLRWCEQGKVAGLRIDHPDGLLDPKEYFERLQHSIASTKVSTQPELPQPLEQQFYVVAEKILSGDERLPRDWPVNGTTGYDFLNQVNGLFVNPANQRAFDELYRDFAGCAQSFEEVAHSAKTKVLLHSFVGELDNLTHSLVGIASSSRHGQDLAFHQLQGALVEVIAAFPVYRTYARRVSRTLTEIERRQVETALNRARGRCGPELGVALNFVGSLLLLQPPADVAGKVQAARRQFVLKFQQLTGPVTAKGIEDTAFYNYTRLLSLNEVGGDPSRFGNSVETFHNYNRITGQFWPHSLLTTSTHDTKRGEDVRARINVLSEIPDEWRQGILRWRELNCEHKTSVEGVSSPDANDEYLLYQTLIGSWPETGNDPKGLLEFRERVSAYLLKAIREAKRNTSWTDPNSKYEEATKRFIEKLLDRSSSGEFLDDLGRLQRRVAYFARFNSLAQTLLKLTCPGVPDLYQGAELWDLNLVDPDNRRPVDFQLRRRLLEDIKHRPPPMTSREVTAETKMFLIWRTLQFRNRHRQLFDEGTYLPLFASGDKANHACAFARVNRNAAVIVAVPRLVVGLAEGQEIAPTGAVWKDTVLTLSSEIPAGPFQNFLTEEKIIISAEKLSLTSTFARFPVALLASVS